MKTVAQTLKSISTLIRKSFQPTDKVLSKFQFNLETETKKKRKEFELGLNQWRTEILTQTEFVVENLASFFHFKKHESIVLSNLCNEKIKLNESISKKTNALSDKKWDSRIVIKTLITLINNQSMNK